MNPSCLPSELQLRVSRQVWSLKAPDQDCTLRFLGKNKQIYSSRRIFHATRTQGQTFTLFRFHPVQKSVMGTLFITCCHSLTKPVRTVCSPKSYSMPKSVNVVLYTSPSQRCLSHSEVQKACLRHWLLQVVNLNHFM